MADFRKMIIGTLAAGLVAASACIAASASTKDFYNQVTESEAAFRWYAGNAEMVNLDPDRYRHATAAVTVYDNKTGRNVVTDSNVDDIGYYESVSAHVDGYSTDKYNFRCSGSISFSGGQYAPIDWSIEKIVSSKN